MKITFNAIKAYLARMSQSLKKFYQDWFVTDADPVQSWAATQKSHYYHPHKFRGSKAWDKSALRKHYRDFY